jgi:hypothetical protein|tara:strand:- start:1149 stop:1322 length:174 start_codon:yes stop_codon:yes gene_type:complete
MSYKEHIEQRIRELTLNINQNISLRNTLEKELHELKKLEYDAMRNESQSSNQQLLKG